MKKAHMLPLALLLLLVACKNTNQKEDIPTVHLDQNIIADENSPDISDEKNKNVLDTEAVWATSWQDAYAEFLRRQTDEHSYFFLWDFNNDGIPELVIDSEYQDAQLLYAKVFSYNGSIYEIGGDHIYAYCTDFFVSDQPMFPGWFTYYHNQMDDSYGYWRLENNEMHFEQLWRTSLLPPDFEQIYYEEISSNTQLIEEAKQLFENKDFLKFHQINETNIQSHIYAAYADAGRVLIHFNLKKHFTLS